VCGAAYGHIIMKTRLLLGFFHFWKVNHIRPEGNMVAHHLAKFAIAH
jgi:hypothetical protein